MRINWLKLVRRRIYKCPTFFKTKQFQFQRSYNCLTFSSNSLKLVNWIVAISSDLQRGQESWLTNQLSTHVPQPRTCLQQVATDIGDVINAWQIRHLKTLLTTSANWVFRNDRSTTIPPLLIQPNCLAIWISLQLTTPANFLLLHVADHGCYLNKAKTISTQYT